MPGWQYLSEELTTNYIDRTAEVNVNDDWSSWFPIDPTGTLNGNPAVGKNLDDTLEVFVKGTDNALYHIRQSANTFVWGHWEPLGGFLTSDPVIWKVHGWDIRYTCQRTR